MTNETSAERLQRRWDAGAPARAERRAERQEGLAAMGPAQRMFVRAGNFVEAVLALLVLTVVALATVGLVVLLVWWIVQGVISADWERTRG